MKIRAIITGVTGMVGEGVLHEALANPRVERVLVIARRPCGVTHSKLKEIVHSNFHDLSSIESQLSSYNACFFCLGVSSVGMKEPEYKKMTYDLTMHVATTLARLNPDMTFCYISGAGTDSSEQGKLMWARVKGKTENDLMKLPFKKAYMFRPGMIKAMKGGKYTLKLYSYFGWIVELMRVVAPGTVVTLNEIGKSMINATISGYSKPVLEIKDIKALAGA
ncbi:MAG TPA: NAD-dependent epimerase/dehydratase family protein [Chryseosolibacter sp.]